MSAVKNREGLWEQQIDGHKYEFSKWGAKESLRILLKLGKVVGKPLGLALGALQPGASLTAVLDKDVKGDLLGRALDALTMSMDEETCFHLIEKFSTDGVMCNGKPINMDLHYEDRLMHLFKVVRAGLEVQYGNFSDAILGSVRLQRPAPSTPDPSTANPPSGA